MPEVFAQGYSDLLSTPRADRTVPRNGKEIDTPPPDCRELDKALQGSG